MWTVGPEKAVLDLEMVLDEGGEVLTFDSYLM